jgi:hypothetical protein
VNDWHALFQELTTDPAGLGYAALGNDWPAVAAAMNAPTQDVIGTVPAYALLRVALAEGFYPRLEIAAAMPVPADLSTPQNQQTLYLISAAKSALGTLKLPVGVAGADAVDILGPASQQMLAILVAGTIVSQAQREMLEALAHTFKSRADILGLGAVLSTDLPEAWRLYGDDLTS